MIIYLDIIFVVNFILDILILWLISVFDRRKVKKCMLLLGGFLGGFIYCLTFFCGVMEQIHFFMFGLAALILSIMVTFKVRNIKILIRLGVIGIISAILVGGAMIAVFNLSNAGYAVTLSLGSIKFSFVIILAFIFYILIKYGGGFITSFSFKRKDYCRIDVFLNNKKTEITALKDTGNFLIEDEGGNKIIISEFQASRNLLSFENQMLFLRKADPVEIISSLTEEIKEKAQLIPFSSLGTSEGFLVAFKVDRAEIHEDKKIVINKALVAIYNGKLSTNKSCNGIINPLIIERHCKVKMKM